jgi:hypothetical protein
MDRKMQNRNKVYGCCEFYLNSSRGKVLKAHRVQKLAGLRFYASFFQNPISAGPVYQ